MGAVVAIAALHSSAVLVGGLVLVGVAIAAFVWCIVEMAAKRPSALDQRLQAYSDGLPSASEEEDEGGGSVELTHTAILARAVELTEGIAERQGFLDKVERRLEQADLPLKPAEVIFVYAVGVVVLSILVLVVTESLLGGFVALVAFGLVPPAMLSVLAKRRTRAFLSQLPDTLQMLAGSLRAGFSLMQGVEAVASEVAEPMGKELRRVVTEARLGRDLEDSLDAVAERMESPDFSWAVMAIRIQREVGGNLAELLMTVSETMLARERLRRDVSSLTAEGRISAIVLGIMPPVLGVVMMVVNPGYMKPLFHEAIGKILLGVAVVGMVVGFLWMRKTVEIDI
jgi:tight adherence protein B